MDGVVFDVSNWLVASALSLVKQGVISETDYAIVLGRSRSIELESLDSEPLIVDDVLVQDARNNSERTRQRLIDLGVLD